MTLRDASRWLLLSAAILLLSLGNLPRFLAFGVRGSDALFTELLFYCAGIIFMIVSGKQLRIPPEFFVISLVLLASYFIGAIEAGYDLIALLYGIRVILMIFSSCSLGLALWELYRERFDKVLLYAIVYPMAVSALIGWIIYFVFPNADSLWLALKAVGIVFAGDPHQKRLLSSYFDPNYFCAIAIFGIVCCHVVHGYTGKLRDVMLEWFLAISALFTLSRSGLGALIMVFGTTTLLQVRNVRITKSSIIGLVWALVLLVASFPLYQEALQRAWLRFFIIASDISALDRLRTARQAVGALENNVFFGIGFNYVPHYFAPISSFDSSLLAIFSTMGLIGGTLFLSAFLLFVVRALIIVNRLEKCGVIRDRHVALYLSVYLLVSIGFASNFNNLFFYQFWYVPVFSLLTYLCYLGQAQGVAEVGSRELLETAV